jgi:signal transduction histidine kinase
MTELGPSEAVALRARRRLFLEGLGVRVFLASVFGVAFTVLAVGHFVSRTNALIAASILFVLAGINFVYFAVGRRAGFPTSHFVAHWAIDILVLTGLLHFLGGVDTPYGALVYCGLVAFAALNGSRSSALLLATFSSVTFISLVILEGTGVLPPVSGMWTHHYSPTGQVVSIVVAVVFIYTLAWVGGTLADQLKAANTSLRASASRIEEQNRTLERRVAERTVELARATEEIQELVHIVTHDLKNVAVGAAETARKLVNNRGDGLPPSVQQYGEHLLEDTRTLARMLEDLLALFRESDTQNTGREWIDVDALVDGILTRLRPEIEDRGIQIGRSSLPEIFAETTKIRHVFDNLLDNACKYVGDTVPARIEVAGEGDGETVTYFVRDNGIGIEERQIERIFQLYHRSPRQTVRGVAQRGHGVGLAIVKRIVERYGGKIWVESSPGKGSTFYVALPRRGEVADGGD